MKSTRNVLQVFAAMLHDASGHHYALELSKAAGVGIGTIYSVLARMEVNGLVTSAVEDINPSLAGRPARRYYTFTGDGEHFARQELRDAQKAFTVGGLTHA